jgi:hypothetical protein
MSWFQLLLFLHVSMAVIWVGGGLMLQVLGFRLAGAGDPARGAAFGHEIEWIGTRVFAPSSLLAFATGVLLVIDSDFYRFRDGWIAASLLLYAVTFPHRSPRLRAGVGPHREADRGGVLRGGAAQAETDPPHSPRPRRPLPRDLPHDREARGRQ